MKGIFFPPFLHVIGLGRWQENSLIFFKNKYLFFLCSFSRNLILLSFSFLCFCKEAVRGENWENTYQYLRSQRWEEHVEQETTRALDPKWTPTRSKYRSTRQITLNRWVGLSHECGIKRDWEQTQFNTPNWRASNCWANPQMWD